MSEELNSKGLNEHGRKVGSYEFYPIGATTLTQLKKAKVIPIRNYGKYSTRKPDALLVDRRNKKKIRVLTVIEYKKGEKFQSDSDRAKTVQQCNDVCQLLHSEVGIATDNESFIWFNPNQPDSKNDYEDTTTTAKRSYTIIRDEN